jgi:hypothetical protein
MRTTNPYCDALGIEVPTVELAMASRDFNYYSLLIAALLEHGAPMTLQNVALRFETAGLGSAAECLRSLQRCKPARAPVYRDGGLYALDPHDEEADLWVFRMGLGPPRVPPVAVPKPPPGPLPDLGLPLLPSHLQEAWRGGRGGGWSDQRLAIAVLDAHGGRMQPEEVVAFLELNGGRSGVSAASARYWRAGAPVQVQDGGAWQLDRAHVFVRPARAAVHERIKSVRRWARPSRDPDELAADHKRRDREQAEHAALLAGMRRIIVHAFPPGRPQALVLLDVTDRRLTTLVGDERSRALVILAAYDVIVAVNVRELLRVIGFDPADRRISELGPPRKTMTLDRRGRTLKITQALLVQGTCGISRPFGDPAVLKRYLDRGEATKFRRRLEADAKSLYALYQYGRLHGTVRVRWGFLDEQVPAPWVHRDESRLYHLMEAAHQRGAELEVVVGNAPGWEAPWARAQFARVVKHAGEWRLWLVDALGAEIFLEDVQLARLAESPIA